MQEDYRLLRIAFNEIIDGFSPVLLENDTVYIKHPVIQDSSLDSLYNKFYKQAIEAGLPTEKIRLDYLRKVKLWDKSDDEELTKTLDQLKRLNTTRRILFIQSQINDIKDQIDIEELKYNSKIHIKYTLIGLTAESWSQSKVNDLAIFNSAYKDKTARLFDSGAFEDSDEFNLFVNAYHERMRFFELSNLKRICMNDFAQELYSLCDESIYKLYGKPIVSLTKFQSDVFIYMRYYNKILAKNPPKEVLESNDPEKLEEWNTGSANFKREMEKYQKGNTTIIGAGSNEWGMKTKNPMEPNLVKMMKEQGKTTLSLKDLLKAKGEI